MIFGSVVGVSTGYEIGNGLGDFVDLAWDASALNAYPTPASALLGAADPDHATELDLAGEPRTPPHDAGCHDAP